MRDVAQTYVTAWALWIQAVALKRLRQKVSGLFILG